MESSKAITVRFPNRDLWLEFRKKLLEDGKSAQQFFVEQIEQYVNTKDGR